MMPPESSLAVLDARTEHLTLAVLLCGVASLALSDFVAPIYWSLPVVAALLRLWRGSSMQLTEMQASFIGWAGFLWVAIEILFGRALVVAFTDFLLILALAVVVELPTVRNHLHRMLVGLFLLLAAAVLTDSVLYVFPLLAMAWFLYRASGCLYAAGLAVDAGGATVNLPATSLRKDLYAVLLVAVIAALLFTLLPRFEFHSLLSARQPHLASSGFSDSVRLGDFGRQVDTTVVMRVEPLERNKASVNQFKQYLLKRYWRGVALSHFTGVGWRRTKEKHHQLFLKGRDIAISAASGMSVVLYREAISHAYILWPDGLLALHTLPGNVEMDGLGVLQFERAPDRRERLYMDVAMQSHQQLEMRPPLSDESDKSHIPNKLSAWVTATAGRGTAVEKLARVIDTLKGWRYDLNTSVDSVHPLAYFLTNKRGHCELYATTLALAARTLGLPSRVVNGYARGEWNEAGGFLMIRQLHAHSWVEVWLDDHWQRMDATPADHYQSSYLNFPRLDQLWESAKLSWYRYVLEFSGADRMGLLQQLWHSLKQLAPWLGLCLVLSIILIVVVKQIKRIWRCWKQQKNQLWPLLDRWLLAHGIKRAQSQPLRTLPLPQDVGKSQWLAFVRAWEQQAYGVDLPWLKRDLKLHLKQLRPRKE
ncbi:MAG: DUF3488 and transglutaminase-like domain-containing protein [Mariprofundus sp.]|nr:DUF3488 and transglutaminase-like domain-containing protein [Mariprofundus sp.]